MPERDVYAAIGENATNEQIKELLKRHKEGPKSEVRVSGNKEELLQHLKDAVSAGFVPTEEVARLVQESEENGDQHVFYYVPINGAAKARVSDGHEVAKRLWGSSWEKATGFPVFKRPECGCEWADFRVGLSKKPQDWLGKLYGQERRLRLVDEKPTPTGGFVRTFEPESEATVCVVRWNAPTHLEIRLPRCDSKGTLLRRLHEVWNRLQLALDQAEFEPWDLRPARHRMLKERKNRGALYQLGSLQFMDSASGKASIQPHTEDEGADEANERGAAIDAYVKAECSCDHLVVTWLQDGSGGVLERNLRVVIGARRNNEVVIEARVNSRAVDYVTNQLRLFSRSEA